MAKAVNDNWSTKNKKAELNDFKKSGVNIVKSEELNGAFVEKIIDWTTFYRRNIHRFIQHYFGIKLHFFQILMLYLMHIFPTATIVCARAISKSFTVSLYGCAVCVLYPNSKVLVTAMTKFLGLLYRNI